MGLLHEGEAPYLIGAGWWGWLLAGRETKKQVAELGRIGEGWTVKVHGVASALKSTF